MLHSVTGVRHIESFMSVMKSPGLHSSSMKERENEVAHHIDSMAKETCTEALLGEVQLFSLDGRYALYKYVLIIILHVYNISKTYNLATITRD